MSLNSLYLDANASYGLLAEVQDAIGYADIGGNPSSVHQDGQRARRVLDEAREEIRLLVGAAPRDMIIFTSGATEANSLALSCGDTSRPILSSPLEHPAVVEPLRSWEILGRKVFWRFPQQIVAEQGLGEDTPNLRTASLCSFMVAHNETGAVTDIARLAELLRASMPSALIHSDAAQALGKLPFRFSELGVDLLTISGHKIGALAGIGALVARHGVQISPLLKGGGQEFGLRAGTQNVLGALSFGIAARVWRARGADLRARQLHASRLLQRCLGERIPQLRWNSDLACGLPNTLSVTIPGIRGDDLVVALDSVGIRVSSGAACSSGRAEPSPSLIALGLSLDDARATLRLSLRADVAPDALSGAADQIASIVSAMRRDHA